MKLEIDSELASPIRPKRPRRITPARAAGLALGFGLGLAVVAEAERAPRRAGPRPLVVRLVAAPGRLAAGPSASIDPGMIHAAPAGIDDRMVIAAPAGIDDAMIIVLPREAPVVAPMPARP
jgi:hypothetical protein